MTSSSVSWTALIACPRAPRTPRAARSSLNDSGAGGNAKNSGALLRQRDGLAAEEADGGAVGAAC